jgi:polyisoprenoid-binding protein YceI
MRLIILLLMLCAAIPAAADELALRPPAAEVAIRTYGLGFFPFDGKFTRFHGVMRYDPQQPGKCQVMLEIDPSSLQMSSQSMTERVTGPDFMDVSRYPNMGFSGECRRDGVSGTLTMHGQTHKLDLDLHTAGGRMTATAQLPRAEWGITAEPFKVGRTIRIRVELPVPPAWEHT